MEVNMSVEEVVNQISALVEKEGKPPRKKEVKEVRSGVNEKCIVLFS
ncbi:hypothetical protein [Peribacillus frigoritolerans]|nr:hypothetical protein [Peribacillus frigoritolerans]